MQNLRGTIKVFTVILILSCLFPITLTYFAQRTESIAEKNAIAAINPVMPQGLGTLQQVQFRDSVEELRKIYRRNFLDSMANKPTVNIPVLKSIYTYNFCRDNALSLGLDLKGGMSLIMEIAEDDVLRKLSNNSANPQFLLAIENAKKAQSTTPGDFLTLFKQEFEKINPNAKLAAIFASGEAYTGKLSMTASNDEVISLLRKDFDAAIQETFQVLKTRIDQFGVASPNISLQANTGRIILELPGVDDPARVRKLLQQTAQLEFWHTYEGEEVYPYMDQANTVLNTALAVEKNDTLDAAINIDTTATAGSQLIGLEPDSLKQKADSAGTAKTDSSKLNPIYRLIQFNVSQDGQRFNEGPVVGYCNGRDTAKLNALLSRSEVRGIFPRDLKLLWGAHTISSEGNVFALYGIRQNTASPEAPLTGTAITDARQDYDPSGIPEVGLSMNALGASKWEKMTGEAVDPQGKRNKSIAIVLDNRVFSAPRVQQKISGGQSQITGINVLEEAIDLANILKSGKLEARTQVIQEQVIGPSLGKESIRAGLMSLALGVIFVFLFMISYYSTSGVIANLAMFLNLFLQVGALISFGASFTLPAMAGIVLTLAMAVDANVIINERVREEIARGKGMRLAVDEGYKHSYSAIIDGNLTTMAIGIVLYLFGLGPIRGFGLVLILGLFISMFTAVLVSRVIFDWAFDRGFNVQFGNKFTMNILKGINIDFISKRKITYPLSIAVFLVFISSMIFYGFDTGVDFKGGRSYVVQFDKDLKTEDVAKALEETFEGIPQVKTYGSNNQLSITTAYLVGTSTPAADSTVEAKLYSGLKPFFTNYPTFEKFRMQNVKSTIVISSSIADDIRQSSYYAVGFGFLFIFLYIFIRFKRVEYAAGALVALVHDPIIVLGVFSLFRTVIPFSLEIDQTIVAAVLTLIGYSVNDTVVVFDRIRETIGLHPTRTLVQNVNDSINQTLSRTIMTVVTVFLVALILFIFGGAPIRGFSFALIIGLLVGTYSSIFIASPVVVDLMNRKKKPVAAA